MSADKASSDSGTEKAGHTNRLVGEQSPYLIQHAHNPVNWYPWGDEAFEQAEKDDKPIFLSIGYATCHWCHVMERKSFSDSEVADLLNEHFISIKVDREERPDIDQLYMTASQLLSGSGGWPLSIFMTPGKKPFFAATYLPKESSYGRAGLMDILPRISAMWHDERERLLSAADEVADRLRAPVKKERPGRPGRNLPLQCYEELLLQFDDTNGGFGAAPKFPLHSQIMFLHRYWRWARSEKALMMAEKTLEKMLSEQKALLIDRDERRVISSGVYRDFQDRMVTEIAAYHEKYPLREGISREELRTTLGSFINPKLFSKAIKDLENGGKIAVAKETVRIQTHAVNLKEDEIRLREEISVIYQNAGLTPPSTKELMERFPGKKKAISDILDVMLSANILVKVNEDMYFHREALECLREDYRALLIKEGRVSPSSFKELTGLSRKFIIPLMEYFDKMKLTIRVDNYRMLRERTA